MTRNCEGTEQLRLFYVCYSVSAHFYVILIINLFVIKCNKNTKLNVPNTLLKKDIRDVTAQPTYKVFAVISKHYTDEKYTNLVKMDKSIDLKECCFSETIENMIDRENL